MNADVLSPRVDGWRFRRLIERCNCTDQPACLMFFISVSLTLRVYGPLLGAVSLFAIFAGESIEGSSDSGSEANSSRGRKPFSGEWTLLPAEFGGVRCCACEFRKW